MQARPERHSRVQRKDHIACLTLVATPGWPDDQPATHAEDRKVRLPGFGPVRLVDDARPKLTDRPEAEGLEVAKRFGHLARRPLSGVHVASRQVGAHDRRPRWIDCGSEPFVDELERGFYGCATRRRSTEDLADGLDRLDIRFYGELEPGTAGLDLRVDAARERPTQPSPSFSRMPPCPRSTASPVSTA